MKSPAVDFDRTCMELAIQQARKAQLDNKRLHPLVGVVAAKEAAVLATAFNGEIRPGEHAEYVLLERKLLNESLVGASIYTTLEPCSIRSSRVPCVERLVERHVAKIFVGMLEPNPYLTGRSLSILEKSGIEVSLFPPDLTAVVEGLNISFSRAARSAPPREQVHLSGYEWDLLETEGVIAGRTREGWYKYFLATGDLINLEHLREFYTPPPQQVEETKHFDVAASEPSRITVVTDLRLIQSVSNDPASLLSLTPQEFERFTAELLEQLGYKDVTTGPGSKDGGVDVSAYIEHPLGIERVIVQCKRHSPDHKVGEPVIKQLLADADIHRAARGLIVTTSYLTRGARLLVDTYRYRLSALEYDEILRLLRGEKHGNKKK